MKEEIVFNNFKILPGHISFQYVDSDSQGEIFFELEPKILPSNDLVAHAISTLCARNTYKKIVYDLSITNEALEFLKDFTHSDIEILQSVHKVATKPTSSKENIILNFSGGFDSLAAKELMPDNITKLVSMDFGGNFSREKDFFQTFDTCTVKTNLLDTPLKRNSWSFMGIASILFSDYLEAKYYTFGGILEASRHNCLTLPASSEKNSFPPFLAAGLSNAPYVLGLTEIATAIIMLQLVPNLTLASLDSVANDGEEKKYRKQLILYSVAKELGINNFLDIKSFVPPRYKLEFGNSFTIDFLAFYLIKILGVEIMGNLYKEVPEEVVKLCNRCDLSFYKKFNPNFLESLPNPLRANFMFKLVSLGIVPYTENDWKEFKEVIRLIDEFSL